LFDDNIQVLNLYHAMDKLRLKYGEEKIQRAAALHFSLRGFNPFNGINGSPASTQESDDSHILPSIKSLNTLIHLKNQNTIQATNQDSTAGNMYEYLLFIRPPSDIKEEIMLIKNEFHAKLDHIQAIKSKPHITLINFAFNSQNEEGLISKIYDAIKTHTTFDLKLKNFNHFKTHTIYIAIETENPIINIIRSLHSTLTLPSSLSFFSWKPHMTIAKGLTADKYNMAMPEFETKNFQAFFITESILLMKRNHPKARYKEVKEFFLET
jgi:2'-5' RNA ligase